MKSIAALALVGFSFVGLMSSAQAAEQATAQATTPVTEYTYGTKLDIDKVVKISPIPNVCGVVPATMTYVDHQGQKHVLEYQVMGTGCAQS